MRRRGFYTALAIVAVLMTVFPFGRASTGAISYASSSPSPLEKLADTSRMAFIRDKDVHIYNPDTGGISKLTSNGKVKAVDARPDGSLIVYSTYKSDQQSGVDTHTIETVRYDGTGHRVAAQWQEENREWIMSISCSTAGNYAYYSYYPHQGVFGSIERINLETGQRSHILDVEATSTTYEGYICPAVSPDGKTLACLHYTWKKDTLGFVACHLCVMNTDGSGRKDIALIMDDPVAYSWSPMLSRPSWSSDGQRIAYTGESGTIWTIGRGGENPLQCTPKIANQHLNPDWSTDDSIITFDLDNWYDSPIYSIYGITSTGGEIFPLTGENGDTQGCWFTTWRAGIQPGDILLCRSAGILSSVLTYTHAGIYVGNGMVAEARPEKDGGIALYPIEDWDYPRQTYVSLYRVNTTRAKREAAASWARTQTRRDPRPVYQWQYIDRSALQNSPSWYCSELVWAAYWNQGIDLAVVGGMGPAQVRYPVSPDHLVDKGKEDGELTRVSHHHEFYPKLWWPGLFLRADSPVDLTLVDPRGGEHSKSSWDLTEAIYLEADIDGDGSSEDLILLEQREFGEYRAKVLPEEGASPEDTFDLIARVRGVRETLARGAKISQIPEEGYPISSPEKTWYLAEGCTAQGMQTYILIQNPGSDTAHIKLTFQTGRGEVPGPEVDLAGGRRTTFLANTYVPGNTDVSTKVESDKPVICERAMYGPRMGWAHDSIGVTVPENVWYLAEGCTAAGMQTYILIQNPGSEAAHIKLTFQTGRGEVPGPEVDLAGGRRITFLANTYVPNNTDVSTKVESDKPVICERAMYGAGMVWAHDAVGYAP